MKLKRGIFHGFYPLQAPLMPQFLWCYGPQTIYKFVYKFRELERYIIYNKPCIIMNTCSHL